MSLPNELVVASFNVHAGIDGWGRPFDAVGACRSLDADVVVLQETWAPDDGQSLAEQVATALGGSAHEHALASGRRALPHPDADDRWMHPLAWRNTSHSVYLDSERPLPARVVRSARFRQGEPGSWGIAVVSRLPVLRTEVIDLGRLARDSVRRAALVAWVDVDGREVAVAGTHMSHLTQGSPRHFVRLARLIDATVGDGPALLAGDMNLWGPPVSLFFNRWRRAVRGRTWPSWRPHSQLDHVLVRGLTIESSEVRPACGSDHCPVRVRLAVPSARPVRRAGSVA